VPVHPLGPGLEHLPVRHRPVHQRVPARHPRVLAATSSSSIHTSVTHRSQFMAELPFLAWQQQPVHDDDDVCRKLEN
jgi:hypothetical protein